MSNVVLDSNPIEPTEHLVAGIVNAAKQQNRDPPLDQWWEEFKQAWTIYKRAQRTIYAIAVATLRVGSSMHYARAVPYGADTCLFSKIHHDNMRHITRSLFALFGTLFTLKAKPTEDFEAFKMRFDLIISRFANWDPPLVFPNALLLFFFLRGLPTQPYGPVKHIILSTESITLEKGVRLLQDAGEMGASLITETLGSGTPAPSTSAPPPPSAVTDATTGAVLTLNHTQSMSQEQLKQLDREKRKNARYKPEGPCIHHGPKLLHATSTSECKDPKLLRRKMRKRKLAPTPVQVQQLHASSSAKAGSTASVPHVQYAPTAVPYPVHVPYHQPYPSPVYQQPMQPYLNLLQHPPLPVPHYMPPQAAPEMHNMLLVHVHDEDACYDADDE